MEIANAHKEMPIDNPSATDSFDIFYCLSLHALCIL
ncbi:hypothetical protein U713_04145 [Rhodobacter capsulatus YW2]|nr:hypothetical protein U713_04145 [Rhodobacter capsulatus YW2]